ncbi:S41 family peptidase [Mucilaginibacter sp.]|jgi:hypothetical protein|uniref:S41 family peptidase n=1 Tax=Mucilaginibacter sp. TaxID=1882438 RepID=UPI00356B403A
MKKIITLIFICVCTSSYNNTVVAQTVPADTLNNYNEKADLPLLGKVWGFLKYHHPNVTKGQFDWDQQLIGVLPAYMATKDRASRDKVLLKWINDLGTIPTYPTIDSVITNVKLKPNLEWISSANFSPEVLRTLNNLKHNHSQADQRYVKFMADDDVVMPFIINELPYATMRFPAYSYRLLAAFRYWNIIAYWYPYKHLAKQDWDKYLKQLTHETLATRNETEYVHFIQSMAASVKDSHAVISSVGLEEVKGKYQAPFSVKILDGKAVVNSMNPNFVKGLDVQKGYILESVNSVPVSKILDNVKPYVSASTNASVLREAGRLVTRTNDTVSNIVLIDNSNQKHSLSIKNIRYSSFIPKGIDFPYQKDSSYYVMKSDVLYINVGAIQRTQIPLLKPILKTVKGVVFDGRQYPGTGAQADLYSELFFPHKIPFIKFSSAVKGYPGVFRFTKPIVVGADNPDYYKGKVAILVNQETQSGGEFFALFIKLIPNAVVVGSETSGADGSVPPAFKLPGGFTTQLTAIGAYHPDGRETQQIGVIPDVKVSQTLNGFREHKDELLDKAVEVILNGKK